jgi:hypothetical protein
VSEGTHIEPSLARLVVPDKIPMRCAAPLIHAFSLSQEDMGDYYLFITCLLRLESKITERSHLMEYRRDLFFTCFLRLESKITERSHLMKYRRPLVDEYKMIPHQPPQCKQRERV